MAFPGSPALLTPSPLSADTNVAERHTIQQGYAQQEGYPDIYPVKSNKSMTYYTYYDERIHVLLVAAHTARGVTLYR